MPPHHVIDSLTITGGLHFREVTFSFHELLTFLIGGRGTGKSSVLHLIRFALGAPIPDEYAEEVDTCVRAVLGSGTATVRARTQHGATYTSSRSYGGEPAVRDGEGAIANVSLSGELFRIEAYAQNEIEGIAKDSAAQLALIDKFAEADVRRLDETVDQIERQLIENAARRRRLEEEIAEDAGREAQLPSVVEALKGVDLGGASTEMRQERERAHEAKVARGRERAAMQALAGELEAVRGALDGFARDAREKLSRAVEGDLERGAHGEIFRRTHAAMQRIAGAVEGSAGRLRAEIAAAEKTAAEEGRSLAASHAKEDEAYQLLVVRDDADRERAAASERLHKRFAELSTVAKRLGDRRREEGAARDESRALLAERARLLAEKSALRKRVCDEWSHELEGEVRASITPEGNATPYANLLADILEGANIRPASFIPTIAKRIRPVDLVSMVENGEVGPLVEIDTVQKGREERAKKILRHLRESGRTHEIAMARFDDLPLIELKVGKRWRPSRQLSTGQRCACILPILLLWSAALLLIDQAEDNLDNAFIYDVLVKRIAKAKENRQLIIATHNPNPPTLGSADRIIVLDVEEEGDGVVAAAGTFEEVKPHVERLEGGREAFRKRGERYGHFPRREGADSEAE